MHPLLLRSFGASLTKTSVSARLALAVLKRQIARGAKVAPKLVRQAESAAAAGAKTTAKGTRKLTLEAGKDVRAATKSRGLAKSRGVATQRKGLQRRGRKLEHALRTSPKSVTAPGGKGAVLSRKIRPEAAEFMAGKRSLPSAMRSGMKARGVEAAAAKRAPMPPSGRAGTRIARPARTPTSGGGETRAIGQPTRTPTSGAGAAYEKTMLAPRPAAMPAPALAPTTTAVGVGRAPIAPPARTIPATQILPRPVAPAPMPAPLPIPAGGTQIMQPGLRPGAPLGQIRPAAPPAPSPAMAAIMPRGGTQIMKGLGGTQMMRRPGA